MKRIILIGLFALSTMASAFATESPLATPPTTLYNLQLDTGTKTATAASGAATLNKSAGVITTEALTTAAAGTYVLTLTNANIAATDQVFASVSMGTSTTGLPDVTSIKPGAGSVVITVQNAAPSAVFNGTLKIAFFTIKN